MSESPLPCFRCQKAISVDAKCLICEYCKDATRCSRCLQVYCTDCYFSVPRMFGPNGFATTGHLHLELCGCCFAKFAEVTK